ncbi:OmpA family protein [Oceanobacter kriegii]|uniref:OmpA family protein n=1 Tax=Oceanobacter kriegii TaxID=64972 RepID=UPI00042349FC|nr:OmpA family protein [Oceanobacter kriegii]
MATVIIGISGWAHAATPADTEITNHAIANYKVGAAAMRQSGSVTFTVQDVSEANPSPIATPATLELLHLSNASGAASANIAASECSDSSGNFTANNEFTLLTGASQSLPGSFGINAQDYGFKVGEPVVIRVEDQDKNLNPVRVDQLDVDLQNENGTDVETVRLTESDVDTGIFYGVINTTDISDDMQNYNCVLSITTGEIAVGTYVDPTDPTDTADDDGYFDPFSRVFDATTGALLNGVVVRIMDQATGQPATVYDDDGVTAYPSELTTGPANSADVAALAVSESFPDGSFRFPYLPNGSYYLEFEGPSNYLIPGETSDAEIAALNGDFLINGASRGGVFSVTDHIFQTDVPADPLDTGVLLSKRASSTTAAVGDFIRFTVTLTLADVELNDGQLRDQLPVGMRYQAGSARFAGELIDEPEISADGRTLLFSIPDMEAGATLSLTYVVQIGTGAEGLLTNKVELIDDLLTANVANARVKIEDEFFREKSRLYGRVYIGDCENETEQEGVPDVRLFMEDGTYVVTDENGEWHIENVTAGAHVVQLDTVTLPGDLELQTCDNLGFHAGRDFSQFVDIQPGSLWRVDYTLKRKTPPSGEVSQQLTQTLAPLDRKDPVSIALNSPVDQQLAYELKLTGEGELEVQNVQQLISLPKGVVYRTGSVLIDGQPAMDPERFGTTLLFRLGDKPKEWTQVITFNGVVSGDTEQGELLTKSVTMFDVDDQKGFKVNPVTTLAKLKIPPAEGVIEQPEQPKFEVFFAELSEEDKLTLDGVVTTLADLQNLQLEVVGHTDTTRIAPRSRHIFPDNQALSEARAGAVAGYLKERLHLQDEQIAASGRGKTDPIASNATAEGRSKNRRVEVNLLGADPKVKLESLGAQIETEKVQMSVDSMRFKNRRRLDIKDEVYEAPKMPDFDENWFKQQDNQPAWVWPPLDRSPEISATDIAIKYHKSQKVKLFLDDKPVSALNIDQIFRSRDNGLMVTKWKGVGIEAGANRFRVEVYDANDTLVDTINSRVQLAETPSRAELVSDQSILLADGINTPVVAVQLFDKDGYPLRPNLQGAVSVASPYALYSEKQQTESAPLLEDAQPMYTIGQDGIAKIRLAPTNKAGEATLTFNYANGQTDEIRVWLKPEPREWILVGIGDMTLGYNQTKGNKTNARAADVDDNIYHDGRVAFYAQGAVAGDWLLTAAYDSAKPGSEAFAHMINADQYYTLYGDASEQHLDASSGRKLYVRIERDRFYAMFGDVDTGLDQTELAEYNRRMTAIKSEFQGEHFEASAFVSQTDNGFVRDVIQGDGTSGLYRLSREDIVSASESITLEVRDRYRSEVVVSSTPLLKDYDYVIDYYDGTIYFKQPIRATDENFNPRYIVAEYEVDGDELGYVAGGRAGVKLMNNKVKAGVSVINQNQPDQQGRITAVDTTVELGKTQIKAEVGKSRQSNTAGEFEDSAYLLEVNQRSEKVQARAYISRRGENYGVDQTEDSENGTRKEGIEASLFLGDKDRINGVAFHHHTLETGYDTYQGQIEWNHTVSPDTQTALGLVTAQSEAAEENLYTDQVSAGISHQLLNDRLQISATALANVTSRSDAYNQLVLGADYKFTQRTSLFSAFETGFSREAPMRTTIGIRTLPWKGATAEQSIEQVKQDDAYQLMALSGLVQDFSITDAWTASLGFDQARNLESNAPAESSDTTEEYYAVYTGFSYNTVAWQWNNRVEYRDGEETDKWVGSSGLYHPISDTLSTGASIDYFRSIASTGYDQQLDAMFDLAIRPQQSRYAVLLQTRWVQTASGDGSSAPDRTRKLINNVHGNFALTDRDQITGQYGIKRTLSQFDDENYAATVDFMAAEWRHHISKRWDIGAHGRRLHSYEAGQSSHGAGLSVGWIPKTNTWLGVGYNFTGFVDDDFSAANFTAKGPYIKIRIKADQNSLSGMRSSFN